MIGLRRLLPFLRPPESRKLEAPNSRRNRTDRGEASERPLEHRTQPLDLLGRCPGVLGPCDGTQRHTSEVGIRVEKPGAATQRGAVPVATLPALQIADERFDRHGGADSL